MQSAHSTWGGGCPWTAGSAWGIGAMAFFVRGPFQALAVDDAQPAALAPDGALIGERPRARRRRRGRCRCSPRSSPGSALLGAYSACCRRTRRRARTVQRRSRTMCEPPVLVGQLHGHCPATRGFAQDPHPPTREGRRRGLLDRLEAGRERLPIDADTGSGRAGPHRRDVLAPSSDSWRTRTSPLATERLPADVPLQGDHLPRLVGPPRGGACRRGRMSSGRMPEWQLG